MQSIHNLISESLKKGVASLYNIPTENLSIAIQPTREEFEGDFTIVVFPFVSYSKKKPEETAKEIGEFVKNDLKEIEAYNVIKGFLNLSVRKAYWIEFLKSISENKEFGFMEPQKESPIVMVEYSCPNSNKPLHLGHIRNNLIGFSISRILKAAG